MLLKVTVGDVQCAYNVMFAEGVKLEPAAMLMPVPSAAVFHPENMKLARVIAEATVWAPLPVVGEGGDPTPLPS